MAQKNYFTLNKKEILNSIKQFEYLSIENLKEILQSLKEKSYVANNLSINSFILKLIDEGLTQNSIVIRGHTKVRYTLRKDLSIYNFCSVLEKNSFFSMTTSLNIQKISEYRSNYIFISKERASRIKRQNIQLTQVDIDNAFSKKPRQTSAYDRLENHIVILLEANNTEAYEIINFNGYKVSSINRVFVELISNIHYFQSSQKVLELFLSIKERLDIKKIYIIIEKFNFIYPYFQLAGFYLEKIGFSKDELSEYYSKKSDLNFYTEKNKDSYEFDKYWNIYY